MPRSRGREKLCVYVSSGLKRRLMYLRADTGKDMSDLTELAFKAFFEVIDNGEITEDTKKRIAELVMIRSMRLGVGCGGC